MNELFGSAQFLDIELFYKVEKTNNGQLIPILLTEEEYNTIKVKEKDKARSLRTQWKMPTWKNANDLIEAATVYNYHKQEDSINWTKYRDSRLKTVLVGWDAKSPQGEAIPCNEEMINMLHPNIALALLNKYDEATSVSKEEEAKNS